MNRLRIQPLVHLFAAVRGIRLRIKFNEKPPANDGERLGWRVHIKLLSEATPFREDG